MAALRREHIVQWAVSVLECGNDENEGICFACGNTSQGYCGLYRGRRLHCDGGSGFAD